MSFKVCCPVCKRKRFHLHCSRCGEIIEVGENYFSVGDEDEVVGECCASICVCDEPEPYDNADELYDEYIDREMGLL